MAGGNERECAHAKGGEEGTEAGGGGVACGEDDARL